KSPQISCRENSTFEHHYFLGGITPWASKRQKLIDEAALPDDLARYNLSTLAAERFTNAGLVAIGIDHFALPGDALDVAHKNGRLRRNFQGYTEDTCQTLIGLGASSISRFPSGYVQNAPATAAYKQRVQADQFAGSRGYVLAQEDHIRARAIELLMCDFEIDLDLLRSEFGNQVAPLGAVLRNISMSFCNFVTLDGRLMHIHPDGRALTRIIPAELDQHVPDGIKYSRAS
ncbi:MAG: coproporphyrinogen III oxidase, partial [Roseovarius sp.]|nr:coproporphyrinogen III oxidase [Roseovarius sp.]